MMIHLAVQYFLYQSVDRCALFAQSPLKKLQIMQFTFAKDRKEQ